MTDKASLEDAIRKGCVTLEWSYSYLASGVKVIDNGTAVLQGNCYYIESESIANISDGSCLWTVDKTAQEVVVENALEESMIGALINDVKLVFDTDGRLRSGSYTTPEGLLISLRFNKVEEIAPQRADFFSGKSFSGKDWVVTDLR